MRGIVCRNANISSKEWIQCLLKIDKDINIYAKRSPDGYAFFAKSLIDLCDDDETDKVIMENKVIIISLSYIHNIRQALNEFIATHITQHSMSFCCDIVMTFIVPNKTFIQNAIKSSSNHDCSLSKWSKEEHDKLISTQSLIIINTANKTFVSLPRNVNDFNKKWKIEPWYCPWNKSEIPFRRICSHIFSKIANEYLPDNFEQNKHEDWSKKIDFTGISSIGYLWHREVIVRMDIKKQSKKNGKIFVRCPNDAVLGRCVRWLKIPHDRICPPPVIEYLHDSYICQRKRAFV